LPEIRQIGGTADRSLGSVPRGTDDREPQMKASDVTFGPSLRDIRSPKELAALLSELGRRIWDAIQKDEEIAELLFTLADAKLALDKVSREDTELDSDAAEAIMGFDYDYDTETRERLRSAVRPREWLKYSLYNFALDWVLDQALMRMKIEQKWPFQQDDGFIKP
jgi:hypothetical protein